MKISKEKLLHQAEVTGFRAEVLEKVFQLLHLLNHLFSHPFLKDRLALKGGTALNLFIFDLPRLSIDIDLNYIGAVDREEMLAERPRIEQAVQAVCQREGFSVRRMPSDHAGGKWSLRYESSLGPGGNLEIDLNFMFRIPLWPVVRRNSHPVGSDWATEIPILDIHELAAGKLAALMARRQARDLFDVHQLLAHGEIDVQLLRLAFVVYGAMNRRDWRTVAQGDVDLFAGDLENHLIPLLRKGIISTTEGISSFGNRLIQECRDALKVVLPLSKQEMAFLNLVLDQGIIDPTVLTADKELITRIERHPLLEWKTINVKQEKGKNRRP